MAGRVLVLLVAAACVVVAVLSLRGDHRCRTLRERAFSAPAGELAGIASRATARCGDPRDEAVIAVALYSRRQAPLAVEVARDMTRKSPDDYNGWLALYRLTGDRGALARAHELDPRGHPRAALMRVLVTGGAGFIGSSVALALAARHDDWDVVACDNLYRRGSELNLPRLRAAGVAFEHADVRQPGDLQRIGAIDAMVECSAEPSVMASGDVIVPVNLIGAYHCFELAARHGAQVVFLSTSRVYPVAAIEGLAYEEAATRFELRDEQAVPGASARGIAEDFPLDGPRTMYGASKLAAELLLTEYDLPWVIDRCGVVAGPWQMGKVDQGVFTHWVLSFHLGRPLSYVGYGGSGKQVRDVLHVADLVELVDDQLARPGHWAGRTFNVGGGREGSLSLLEASAICAELTGNDMALGVVSETRAGDVPCYLSDCTALFAHSDWRPQRDARTVLADTHAWIAEHEALVRATL